MTQLQLSTLLKHGHVVFSYIEYPTYNGCYNYLFNEGFFIVNCNQIKSVPRGNEPYIHDLIRLEGCDKSSFELGHINIKFGLIP